MSMDGYDVQPGDITTDSQMWQTVASQLSSASSSSSSVHLDENQLSFASRNGMAAAYVQVVQRFARIASEGNTEALKHSETLSNVGTNYQGTDTDSSQRLRTSGQGMDGGGL